MPDRLRWFDQKIETSEENRDAGCESPDAWDGSFACPTPNGIWRSAMVRVYALRHPCVATRRRDAQMRE